MMPDKSKQRLQKQIATLCSLLLVFLWSISNKKPPEKSCKNEKEKEQKGKQERYFFPCCKLHDMATL
jgi:hypothetical protein